MLLVVAFGLAGGFVRVPYVALGPGPTFNTFGTVANKSTGKDETIVEITGQETFPTKGNLNMTTVSVTDHLTIFGALGLWASGRYALAPREEIYPPGKSEKQVEEENVKAFKDSKSTAEVAALRYLGYPTKALVGEIVKGSPSDGAIEPGDELIEVAGRPVDNAEQVRDALTGSKPGDKVDVRFRRGELEQSATLTLAARDDRQQGFLGVSAIDRPDVPFHITIRLGDTGGPSAGLIFALAIVDKLTPGELNGGRFIAGTGEISEDGTVGPIGGIPFKMVAAKQAGATTFLVPEENCAEAKARAPQDLELIKVDTLTSAVKSLEALREGRAVPRC